MATGTDTMFPATPELGTAVYVNGWLLSRLEGSATWLIGIYLDHSDNVIIGFCRALLRLVFRHQELRRACFGRSVVPF